MAKPFEVSAIPESLRAGTPALLPSGTVTFAFTDIEGSTQRWERDRSAMQDAVRRHDGMMRSAIGEHQGYVFKTVGDAFCAAFGRPEDAVAAMLAAQRALGADDFTAVDGLRVRAAIHTGTADERDGDYFGPAVNRVARLLAVAHGGQVVVSGVTTDLVQGVLPPRASLRDLGEHRLKDLTRPEHVYQLLAPDLRAEFPALRSLDALPNNLPRVLTSFIGRATEVAEISALIEQHQLVTLVGSGGIGKTRTSLQVAANLLDGSGDGVWFIELAPLAVGSYIPSTVMHALGLTPASDDDPVANLTRALAPKHALLVFDNCEHLIEPAAMVIAAILRSCPQIKILASSRQGLGIAGEETYRLPALDVPPASVSEQLTATAAMQTGAIELFVARARAVDKRFSLSDENAATVAEICRRLDGIPLAIELAAARVKILSPRQLNQRLDERFRVLTGGSRDVLPRQQTLRALIDWSHDLLDERERALFRRLSIFANGFTLEGAAAVGSSDELDELDVFDVLASLVDKSLVLAEPAGDALRYRFLQSTRAYSREKLDAAGEQKRSAERHLRYLRDRFTDVYERYTQTAQPAELHELFAAEIDDVRAALTYAIVEDAPLGAELFVCTGSIWLAFGLNVEATLYVEAFMKLLPRTNNVLMAHLYARSSVLTSWAVNSHAVAMAGEAVTHARASGDPEVLAETLSYFASYSAASGNCDAAEAALSEAEAIPRLSRLRTLANLKTRAFLTSHGNDLPAAARTNEKLMKELRAIGDTFGEFLSIINLAEIEHARGRTAEAIALVQNALATERFRKHRSSLDGTLINLAGYLIAVNEIDAAKRAACEAIRQSDVADAQSALVTVAIEHLALTHAVGGDLVRAATLAGYVDANFEATEFRRGFNERTTCDRLTALLAAQLSADVIARLRAEGAALTTPAAIAFALEET